MIKLLRVDTSGAVPCPYVQNPMSDRLRGLKAFGGSSLAGRFPDMSLVVTDDPSKEAPSGLVDYFPVGYLNVVSATLKSALESVAAECEYFPVTVFYNEEPASWYFVANPLRRFRAIDLEKSDVELDDELGDALSVRRLVIDERRFDSVNLAVVDEINRIGVQPEVAMALEASGCTGFVFIDPALVKY